MRNVALATDKNQIYFLMFILLKVIFFYSLDLVNDSNSAKKYFSKLFK